MAGIFKEVIYTWDYVVYMMLNPLVVLIPFAIIHTPIKGHVKKYLVLYFSVLALLFGAMYVDGTLTKILMHVLLVAVVSIVLKDKFINIMTIHLSVMLIAALIDMVLVILVMKITGLDNDAYFANFKVMTIEVIISGALYTVVLKVVNIKKFINKNMDILKKISALLINILLFVMVTRYLLENFTSDIFASSVQLLFVFVGIVIVTVFVFAVFYDITKEKRLAVASEQHIKSISTMIAYIKGEQHDFKNHLHIIGQLNDNEKKEEISEYIAALGGHLKKIEQPLSFGDSILGAILKNKFYYAQQKNIDMFFNINSENMPCKNYEQVKVITNLVDNAINEVEKIAGEKSISISTKEVENVFILSIANTIGSKDEIVIDELFSKKRLNVEKNHGFGLFEVNKIVKKYKGSINIVIEKNNIQFDIIFPAKV
jgi:two-component system, LytTR family, sensor histidine kinase AgrC